MKSAVLGLAILLLAASPTAIFKLPESLHSYTTWEQISPEKYSIPGHLASMCVAASHAGEELLPSDPLTHVPVRVFVNSVGAGAVRAKHQFPEGSILVKEKLQRSGHGVIAHQGVMIKGKKGWEFSCYPSYQGESFERCAECHKTASHDFVFTPYLQKK